jgi:hypothetical protein
MSVIGVIERMTGEEFGRAWERAREYAAGDQNVPAADLPVIRTLAAQVRHLDAVRLAALNPSLTYGDDMTTARARRTAPPAEVPATEPASAEAPETPGAAEPEPAAPGTSQDAPEPAHEPALDEAGPYDFGAHARRVFGTPWPAFADPPVVFTPEARAAANETDRAALAAEHEGRAAAAAKEQDAAKRQNDRLDDYLLMRSQRFPADEATA